MLSPLSNRIGNAAILVLFAGTLVICVSMALLVSLWMGYSSSRIWMSATAADSLSVMVASLSTILQNTINFQVGVAAAMIAAIVLEKQDVLLSEAASCLLVRGSYRSWNLATLLWSGSPWRGRGAGIRLSSLTALTTVLFAAACIIQFSSILLISDIGLGTAVGRANVSYLAFGINVSSGTSNLAPFGAVDSARSIWQRSPDAYPTFAEYHEEPPEYASADIDDTGKTLRAFLPHGSAERQTLHSYNGRATVLDARVMCQAPDLTHFNISRKFTSSNRSLIALSGEASPTYIAQRLVNASLSNSTMNPIPFDCITPEPNTMGKGSPKQSQPSLSMCKLNSNGLMRLASEFESLSQSGTEFGYGPAANSSTGAVYLIVKVTDNHDNGTSKSTSTNDIFRRGQWTEAAYGRGSPDSSFDISLTLCYTSFVAATFDITASSSEARTEPLAVTSVGPTTEAVDMTSLTKQLVGSNDTAHVMTEEERGILHLAPLQSWVANGTEGPDLLTSRLSVTAGGSSSSNNNNIVMWPAPSTSGGGANSTDWTVADPSHAFLFQHLLRNGYSAAHALQATLTVLSGMKYYDSLPSFDEFAPASQTFFVAANVPVRSRGMAAVAAAVVLHLAATLAVAVLFARTCRVSAVGSAWQTLLHAARADAASAELFGFDALDDARDPDFRDAVAKLGKEDTRVGVVRSDKDGRVGLRIRWAGSCSNSQFHVGHVDKEAGGNGAGASDSGSLDPPSPSERPRRMVWSRFFVVRSTDMLASHQTPYIGC